MKYKVGDKVNIKKRYLKNKQSKATIALVSDDFYRIKEDALQFPWTDEMFEDKIQPIKKTIEHIISDKKTIVIIHNEDGTYLKGISQCNPEDTFNEHIGFMLAYTRALGIDDDNITKDENNLHTCPDLDLIAELEKRFIFDKMIFDSDYSMLKDELDFKNKKLKKLEDK